METRVELATRLALLLRDLAMACEEAATGDEEAKRVLRNHTDDGIVALVVGRREIERLSIHDDDACPICGDDEGHCTCPLPPDECPTCGKRLVECRCHTHPSHFSAEY